MMMKRWLLLSCCCWMNLAVAIAAPANGHVKTPNFELASKTTSFDQGSYFSDKTITKSPTNDSVIVIRYPLITNETDVNSQKFNQAIKRFIDAKISQFQHETTNDTTGKKVVTKEPSSIHINYKIFTNIPQKLVSIRFSTAEFLKGMAHPNYHTDVINYSLQEGKMLALEDIFNPNSRYLTVIANHCYQQLKIELKTDDRWLRDGTAASTDNYAHWNITPYGILITLDPYQVAPYAFGTHTIMVPYPPLKKLLNKKFMLAHTINLWK